MKLKILCAAFIIGCSDNTSHQNAGGGGGYKNATVSGYFEYNGRRLDFLDGLVDFATEPLESEKYSITCILSHDSFTKDQINTIRKGKWLDLNHQSVPNGFPMIQSTSNGLPLSPGVCISFGEWKIATPPKPDKMAIGLSLTYFDKSYTHCTFILDRSEFEILSIQQDPLTVGFITEGTRSMGDEKIKWRIEFEGEFYGDPWPFYRHYTGPWYIPPQKDSAEQVAPSNR